MNFRISSVNKRVREQNFDEAVRTLKAVWRFRVKKQSRVRAESLVAIPSGIGSINNADMGRLSVLGVLGLLYLYRKDTMPVSSAERLFLFIAP